MQPVYRERCVLKSSSVWARLYYNSSHSEGGGDSWANPAINALFTSLVCILRQGDFSELGHKNETNSGVSYSLLTFDQFSLVVLQPLLFTRSGISQNPSRVHSLHNRYRSKLSYWKFCLHMIHARYIILYQ